MKIKRNIPRPNSSILKKIKNETLLPTSSSSYLNTTPKKQKLKISKSKESLFKPTKVSMNKFLKKVIQQVNWMF